MRRLIPAHAIGNLQALTRPLLDGTVLTGTIPEAIGNLLALTLLHFGDNPLTGTIPETIGSFQATDTTSEPTSPLLDGRASPH